MKRVFYSLLGVVCFVPLARGGVDQGNPKAQTFFNMKHKYYFDIPETGRVDPSSGAERVKVIANGILEAEGYMCVGAAGEQCTRGQVCEEAEPRPGIKLQWRGSRCDSKKLKQIYDLMKKRIKEHVIKGVE